MQLLFKSCSYKQARSHSIKTLVNLIYSPSNFRKYIFICSACNFPGIIYIGMTHSETEILSILLKQYLLKKNHDFIHCYLVNHFSSSHLVILVSFSHSIFLWLRTLEPYLLLKLTIFLNGLCFVFHSETDEMISCFKQIIWPKYKHS